MNLFRPLVARLKNFLGAVVREQIDEVIKYRLADTQFALHARALFDSARFIEEHIPLSKNFTPSELRQRGLELAPKHGLVLEFGVWKGLWINRIATMAGERLVYGFDSFEGLPEPWCVYEPGYLKVDSLPAVRANVQLVKGWFHDTLPKFLAEHPEPVAFVHVDCDLYSSTKTVLDHLRPRLQRGTVLILDDFFMTPGWQRDEFRAWFDFVAAHPEITWEYIGYQRHYGSVGVRITEISDLVEQTWSPATQYDGDGRS